MRPYKVHGVDGFGRPAVGRVYWKKSYRRIKAARAAGAVIVINTSYRYTGRRLGFDRVEILTQTNGRRADRPIQVIWAGWRKDSAEKTEKPETFSD